MELANKEIELIKDPKPDQRCSFCYSAVNNPLRYGDMYKYKNIMAHYFCVLMSSQLQQNGEDSEGFFGFLIKDLTKELERAKSVKCCFCKRGGATAQCNVKVRYKQKCSNSFHFTCGITHGTLHYFFGKFQSMCHIHRRPQKIPEEFVKDSATQCWICHDIIQDVNSSSSSLWAACCKKSYFHKDCVQHQAYVSGEYHFKCPLCNNHEKFKQAMLRCGIFLPIRDAEWEREPNAYSDLYREHNSCDTEPCLCPHKGKDDDTRKYNSGAWDLIRCSTCGSEGTHRPCSGLPLKGDISWNCGTCRQVLLSKQQQSSGAGTSLAAVETEPKNIEPDTCCADFCTCNKGREFRADKGMYRTVYCADCEYSWIHERCRSAQYQGIGKGEWICVGCELSDSEEAEPPAAAASRASARGGASSADEPPPSLETRTLKQVSSPCYVVLQPMSSRYFYRSIAHRLSKGAYLRMLHRERVRVNEKSKMSDSGCESRDGSVMGRDDSVKGKGESVISFGLNGMDGGELCDMSVLSLTTPSSKESGMTKGICDENNELSLQLPVEKGDGYDVGSDDSQEARHSSSTKIVVTAEMHTDPESKLTGYVSSMFLSENLKMCALTHCLRSLFSPVKEVKECDEMNVGIDNTSIPQGKTDLTAGDDEFRSSDEKKVDETLTEDSNQADITVSNDKVDVCNSEDDQARHDLGDLAISDDKVNNSNESKVAEAVSDTAVNCDEVIIDVQNVNCDEVSTDVQNMISNELSDSGISEMKDNVDVSETIQENIGEAQNDIADIVNCKDDNNEIKTDELCKMCDSQDLNMDNDRIDGDSLKDSEVLDQSNNNVVDSFSNNNNSELKDSNVQNDIVKSCSTLDVDLDSTLNTNVGLCKTFVEKYSELNNKKRKSIKFKKYDSVVGHSCNVKRVTRKHNPSLCSKNKCEIYSSHCNEYSDKSKECLKESKDESKSVVNGDDETMDEQDNLDAKVAESKENIDEHKGKRQVNVLEIKFPLKHGTCILEPDEMLLKRNKLLIQYDTEVEYQSNMNFETKTVVTKQEYDFINKNEVPIDEKSDMVFTNAKKEPCSNEHVSFNAFKEKDNSESKFYKCKMEVNELSEEEKKSMTDNTDENTEARLCKSNVKLNANHKTRKEFHKIKNELVIKSNSRFVSKRKKRSWNFLKSQHYTVVGKTEKVEVSEENKIKTVEVIKEQLYSNRINKKDEVAINEITDLVNITINKHDLEDQENINVSNKKAHIKNETDKNIEISTNSSTEGGREVNDLYNKDIPHIVDNTEEINRNNKIKIDFNNLDENINKTQRRKRKTSEAHYQDAKRQVNMVVSKTSAGDEESKSKTIDEKIIETSNETDSRQGVGDCETHENDGQIANKTPDGKKVNLSAVKSLDKQIKPLSSKKIGRRTDENVVQKSNRTPDDKKINLIAVQSSEKQIKPSSSKKIGSSQSGTHQIVMQNSNKTPNDKKVNLIAVKSSDKQIKTFSSKKIYEYFTCTQTSMSLHDSIDNFGNTTNRETKTRNTRNTGNIWLSTSSNNIGRNSNDTEHNTSDARPDTRNTRHNIQNANERLRNTYERLAKKRSLSERKHEEEPKTKRHRLCNLTNTPPKILKDEKPVAKTNSNKKQTPRKGHSKSACKQDTTSRKIYEFFSVQNPVTPNAKLENDSGPDDEADSINKATEKMLVDDVNKPDRIGKADDVIVDDNSKQLESKYKLPERFTNCDLINKHRSCKETFSDEITASDVINKETTSKETLPNTLTTSNDIMNGPPTSIITPSSSNIRCVREYVINKQTTSKETLPYELTSSSDFINGPPTPNITSSTSNIRSVRESTRRSSLVSILSNSDAKPSVPESREARALRRRSVKEAHHGDENFSPNKMATLPNRTNESPSMKRASSRLSVARKDLSLFL